MSGPGLDFDVLVVGSGFGGSVTALRLTEKGYRVGVLEAGARFEDDDLPETSFEVTKYLFRPEVGCYGIQRIDALRDCLIVSGAGVGGGSLVYANTLYEPLPAFYNDPQWSHITDWQDELAPYYDQAKRMLGVVENPLRTPSDDVMEKVATEMGVGDTFHPTPVGVFFGGPGAGMGQTVDDPFFGGAGPERKTCIGCGSCMTGCRHNAKNTLVKNYLHLAESNGAKVLAAHHRHPDRPAPGRWVRRAREVHEGEDVAALGAAGADRRPGRAVRVVARHPAAAAPDEGRGPPAAPLRPAGPPLAHQLRVDRRRGRTGHHGRLQPGHRDHVELPPRRQHPHRAGPLRPRQQPDVAAPVGDDRRRRRRAALADLAARDVAAAPQRRRTSTT